MKSDEILEEVWRIKDTLAQACGYDVDRLFDDLGHLTAEEKKAGRIIIRSAQELRQCAATEAERRQSEALALKESAPHASQESP